MKRQMDEFLEFLGAERRLSPNTLAAYNNDLRQFVRYLSLRNANPLSNGLGHVNGNGHRAMQETEVAPDAINREAVAGFFLSLRDDKGYSAATIARKMAAVKSLFQYLVRQGVIRHSPAADIGSPEVKKPLPRAISVSDVDLLIKQADKKTTPEGYRDSAMMHLLYATGMRVTELVSLDVDDLDRDSGTVHCVGRGARARELPIDDKTVAALRAYLHRGRPALLRSSTPQSALFLNHRGQRLTRQGFWLIMKAVTRDSGVTSDVTPHTLRHSFAAHRLRDGLTLARLRELLGHANISTTQIYTQVISEPGHPVIADRGLALAGRR